MTAVGDVSSLIGSIGGLFPKNTDTEGNSTLDANTNSDTANVAGSILKGATDTSQSQVSNTGTTQNQSTSQNTSTTQTTAASASDAALKAITSNIGLAQSNATDSSKTTDLVSNILTQAAMTFAPTKTLATGAGVYNSPTLSMLSDFAKGSATAQAAGAVLNYTTAQQGLAEGAASDLAKTTATTTAAAGSTSSQVSQLLSSVMQSLFSNTAQNTSQDLLTANQGTSTGHQDQTTTSSQQGSSGISIVCTELMKQGKLDKKLWVENSRQFQKYSQLSKDSYYFWARPAVKYLQEHSDSKLSRALGSVMLARCNGKWYGIAVVNTITFFSGLIMLASQNTSDYPALEF